MTTITRIPLPTHSPTEHALLVAVERPGQTWAAADSLEELARLAETVDVEVVGSVTQKLRPPPGRHLRRQGQAGGDQGAARRRSTTTWSWSTTSSRRRSSATWKSALDVKVIDRTALILDIFARRAATHEGRAAGRAGPARVPPAAPDRSLDPPLAAGRRAASVCAAPARPSSRVDRRELGKRIVHLKRELDEVRTPPPALPRAPPRACRSRSSPWSATPTPANRTLLNALTGADVLAEDKLFATLDPTTRARRPAAVAARCLVTDTVGFINNLPTHADRRLPRHARRDQRGDLLVHVLDVTHPNAAEQVQTVIDVLEELGADDKPMITALNKVDRLVPEPLNGAAPPPDLPDLLARLGSAAELASDPVAISAEQGWGLDQLLARIETALEVDAGFVPVRLSVPFARTDLVDRFHRTGRVEETRFDETGTTIVGSLPAAALGRFAPYVAVRERSPKVVGGGQ